MPVLSLHSTGEQNRDKDKHTYGHKMCPCKRNKKREKLENEGRGEIKSDEKRRMGENKNSS